MPLTSKSTNKLREELEGIRDRISAKIRHITFTHQKLPFERLSKGRQLKELVLMCIKAIDDEDEKKLIEYIEELKNKGIKINI